MAYTNTKNIPLYLAAAIVRDTYDYVDNPKYISATSLLKPTKQLVLAGRNTVETSGDIDLETLIPMFFGNSLHDSVEASWLDEKTLPRALELLGYTPDQIQAVVVNPKSVKPNQIPIYIEQRGHKKILGYTVGGKFDAVIEGLVHDLKSTSAFSWLYGGREEDYKMQGSIYRWIHQDKITEDFIRITFVFTDWSKMSAAQNPNYPQARVAHKDIELLSIKDTEKWIKKKITEITNSLDLPEEDLIPCTEEEMWLTKPSYKYFSDPAKITGRSTKNFTDYNEASQFMQSKGKGIIIATPRTAKRCVPEYCGGYHECVQRTQYD